MYDLAFARACDAVKQVKSYPFSERKREGGSPRLDERFHVTSVYRHYEAHVRAGRTFSRNREFVQKSRAIRGGGLVRDDPEHLWFPDKRAFESYVPVKYPLCTFTTRKLVVTVKGRCQFVTIL